MKESKRWMDGWYQIVCSIAALERIKSIYIRNRKYFLEVYYVVIFVMAAFSGFY